jgi:hypothetical protein
MLKKIIISIVTFFSFVQVIAAENWIEGGIYSTPIEHGYNVLKILKVDSGGVHVRIYSNLYSERPKSIDETKLFMAGIDRDKDTPLGMGHAPISYRSFSTWGAEFVQKSKVIEEELEGYNMWLEGNGGYF